MTKKEFDRMKPGDKVILKEEDDWALHNGIDAGVPVTVEEKVDPHGSFKIKEAKGSGSGLGSAYYTYWDLVPSRKVTVKQLLGEKG